MARARSVSWTLVDQGISSATNAGVAVLVAREASARGFGAVSIVFLLYAVVLGVTTAMASDPMLVAHGTSTGDRARDAAAAATGTALLVGAITGGLAIVGAPFVPAEMRWPLAALGLSMPGLLTQDAFRSVFFASGRPSRAAANDGAWAVCQAVGFAAVLLLDRSPHPGLLVLIWGGSATAAAVLAYFQAAVGPSPRASAGWLVTHRRLAISLTFDFVVMTGAGYLAMGAASVAAGLVAIAALRGAQLLFGPLVILTSGLKPLVLREGAQLRETGERGRLARTAGMLAALLFALPLVWGVALLVLPEAWGVAVLGDSWRPAREVLPFIGLAIAARGLGASPSWGLRVLSAGRRIVKARAFDAVATIGLAVVGAAVWEARGAAVGMAAANLVAAAVWWFHFRRADGERILAGTCAS